MKLARFFCTRYIISLEPEIEEVSLRGRGVKRVSWWSASRHLAQSCGHAHP